MSLYAKKNRLFALGIAAASFLLLSGKEYTPISPPEGNLKIGNKKIQRKARPELL